MTRFKPSRAGVINLWDYVDEEFVFADGRLVLRGHNGSGKTKALEVLFPFVLDGVADARRLDPFSGDNRTMKSNLLYRGQESEHGYVWMEFLAPSGETVTLVIGLRAHRHRDGVVTSFYVTSKRLGVDFGLLTVDGRPLTDRRLREALEPGSYAKTATEYRELVDNRLFGLGRERYNQLLDLLLALRRPLLAKDLDPAKVSATLTAGLSPVDETLVDQAARDFENLAAVQSLHDDLSRANDAVRVFLDHYREYLRVHTRSHLDRVDTRTAQAVAHGTALRRAVAETTRAAAAKRAAEQSRDTTADHLTKLTTRLETLKQHDAYRAQSDLDHLRHQIAETTDHLTKEQTRLTNSRHHASALRAEAESAATRLTAKRTTLTHHRTALAEAAHTARIPTDPAPRPASPPEGAAGSEAGGTARHATALESGDTARVAEDGGMTRSAGGPGSSGAAEASVRSSDGPGARRPRALRVEGAEAGHADGLDSVRARAAVRREDVAEVRRELGALEKARGDRQRAESRLGEAREGLSRREAEVAGGETGLEAARERAAARLEEWVSRWGGATGIALKPLAEVLERAGEPGAVTLGEAFAELSEELRAETITGVAELRAQAESIAEGLRGLAAERAEIAAERDDAPPVAPGAEREGREGAAFWQLVRFADGLSDEEAAGLEGALDGAGILTAWVHPDPERTIQAYETRVADGFLLPGAPAAGAPETGAPAARASAVGAPAEGVPVAGAPAAGASTTGRSLADVLLAESHEAVPVGVIQAVLASIPLASGDDPAVPGVGLCGRFSFGVRVGARPKERPEYIGATYRAQRRRARLEACDVAAGRLKEEQEAVRREQERLRGVLDDLSAARRALPDVEPVLRALKEAERGSVLLGQAREGVSAARRELDETAAATEAAERRVRQAAAERDLPATEEGLAVVARAVDDFVAAGELLAREREDIAQLERDLASRWDTVERLEAQDREDEESLAERREALAVLEERLAARTEALGSSLKEILRQVGEAEREIREAEAARARHEAVVAAEHDALVKARAAAEHGERALAEAWDVLLEQLVAFAPFARPDLRQVLDVESATLWPEHWEAAEELGERTAELIVAGREPEEAVREVLPPAAAEILDAYRAALPAGRPVGENARKTTRDAMSDALKEFGDALEQCEEDYRLDLDAGEVVTVQVIDVEGRGPVPAFADRIAGRLVEQGLLLDERERTVLEDELLSSLAQQIHDRVRLARELVRGMDSDTRSRPMSTGSTVGIRWVRSDRLDERQRAVANLLTRDAGALGPDGLAELRGLLREMIRAHRARHVRAGYLEALRVVVDYRTWFEFQLRLTEPHGGEVTLTRAKHSQMSGGEKSAAIHLPLFAAANALYSSAKDTCPRMIALDEAFAGIDDRYKPELLGLTVKFDLDAFMTGHDLWASYASVPMAAHYDMHSDKASHTVSTMLVLWDGAALLDADAAYSGNDALAETLLGFPPNRRSPAESGLLASLTED
ncbi:SbcC/MukB-like Walker B domain-containing protein [Actinocorallia aurantiaca]|uniref:TIGR02680 family protein n=1 Tax=Actinocorallia aurantiaca TaxID=46204 RepID=A0ABP6GUV7_9ACTN